MHSRFFCIIPIPRQKKIGPKGPPGFFPPHTKDLGQGLGYILFPLFARVGHRDLDHGVRGNLLSVLHIMHKVIHYALKFKALTWKWINPMACISQKFLSDIIESE